MLCCSQGARSGSVSNHWKVQPGYLLRRPKTRRPQIHHRPPPDLHPCCLLPCRNGAAISWHYRKMPEHLCAHTAELAAPVLELSARLALHRRQQRWPQKTYGDRGCHDLLGCSFPATPACAHCRNLPRTRCARWWLWQQLHGMHLRLWHSSTSMNVHKCAVKSSQVNYVCELLGLDCLPNGHCTTPKNSRRLPVTASSALGIRGPCCAGL